MDRTHDRYPRTLSEAFGPYTSTYFEPDPPICIFRAAWAAVLSLFRRSNHGE